MALLTADQILQADDLNYIDVEVESWGGTVRLRDVTAQAQVRLRETFQDQNVDEATKIARVLVECLVDENNDQLFDESQIHELTKKSPTVLVELFNAAIGLIGLDQSARNGAKKN